MKIQKILIGIVFLCAIISAIMIFNAVINKDNNDDVENIDTTNNTNNVNGVNTSTNNSSASNGGVSTGGSGSGESTIDEDGEALVENGVVSSEKKLLDESLMLNEASLYIQALKNAYGEDKSLAEDKDATYKYLAPYFDIEKEELKKFSNDLATKSNTKDSTIVIKENVHAVKQLSDDSFAVYFQLKGNFYDSKGKITDSLTSPYHIMTLTKTKKSYSITYLSFSAESYVKQQ